ncbi:hypothetical protein [Moritella yayanosii]|uniref:hypothetical protein n=1 Tax=Moritella yayanosii TaxID=69539 RepID=UPI000DDAD0D3|nr:hypothetical protein [Moritella yayanosii]
MGSLELHIFPQLGNHPLSGIKVAFEKPKKKHLPKITPAELPNLMSALNIASIKIVTRPNEVATAK